METVRKFDAQVERVESGAIQFGDDWPGLFLRGDESFNIAMNINTVERALAMLEDGAITPKEFRNLCGIPMMTLTGLKQTIIHNVVVGGAKRFPALLEDRAATDPKNGPTPDVSEEINEPEELHKGRNWPTE